MGPLASVAHEEGASLLENAVQMHDGQAPAVRSGDDAIGRLEDESACARHAGIVTHRSAVGVRRSAVVVHGDTVVIVTAAL